MKKSIASIAIGLVLSLGMTINANAEEGKFKQSNDTNVKVQNIQEPLNNARAKNGWYDLGYGEWAYVKNGNFVFEEWVKYGGNWYYFNYNGCMVRGTSYYIEGREYFFGDNGKLRKGWSRVIYDGLEGWIYSDSSGVIKKSSWVKDSGKWFYMDYNGIMIQNEVQNLEGTRYFFKSDGSMAVNGWSNDGYNWFYATSTGALKKSTWLKQNNKWYYIDDYAYMLKDQAYEIGGKAYFFKSDGSMATNGWVRDEYSWYYADKSGYLVKNGWKNISNKWYYFSLYGMVEDSWIGTDYYVGSDGVMAKGWKGIECETYGYKHSYYFASDGKLVRNKQIGSYWVNEYGYYGDDAHSHSVG